MHKDFSPSRYYRVPIISILIILFLILSNSNGIADTFPSLYGSDQEHWVFVPINSEHTFNVDGIWNEDVETDWVVDNIYMITDYSNAYNLWMDPSYDYTFEVGDYKIEAVIYGEDDALPKETHLWNVTVNQSQLFQNEWLDENSNSGVSRLLYGPHIYVEIDSEPPDSSGNIISTVTVENPNYAWIECIPTIVKNSTGARIIHVPDLAEYDTTISSVLSIFNRNVPETSNGGDILEGRHVGILEWPPIFGSKPKIKYRVETSPGDRIELKLNYRCADITELTEMTNAQLFALNFALPFLRYASALYSPDTGDVILPILMNGVAKIVNDAFPENVGENLGSADGIFEIFLSLFDYLSEKLAENELSEYIEGIVFESLDNLYDSYQYLEHAQELPGYQDAKNALAKNLPDFQKSLLNLSKIIGASGELINTLFIAINFSILPENEIVVLEHKNSLNVVTEINNYDVNHPYRPAEPFIPLTNLQDVLTEKGMATIASYYDEEVLYWEIGSLINFRLLIGNWIASGGDSVTTLKNIYPIIELYSPDNEKVESLRLDNVVDQKFNEPGNFIADYVLNNGGSFEQVDRASSIVEPDDMLYVRIENYNLINNNHSYGSHNYYTGKYKLQYQIYMNNVPWIDDYKKIEVSSLKEIPVIIYDTDNPDAPASFTAIIETDFVNISWDSPIQDQNEMPVNRDIAGYLVYREISPELAVSDSSEPFHSVPVGTNFFLEERSDLQPDITYYYSIRSVDFHGDISQPVEPIAIYNPDDSQPYFQNPAISPINPNNTQNVSFSIQYIDDNGPNVDDNSVKVVVEGTPYTMTSSSNNSESVFSWGGQVFPAGTYKYYFTGTQNGKQFTYPEGSGFLSFTISEVNPDGLSVIANPSILSICGYESSTVTATLTIGEVPISGEEVAFVILNGSGHLSSPTTIFTNQNGQAFVTFTPDTIGTTTIAAVVNGLPLAETDVIVSNCAADISISMYMKDCTENTSKYNIKARITESGTDTAIKNELVTVTVQKTDGTIFGEMYDYDDNTGNPLLTQTDYHGEIDVLLSVSEKSEVQIIVECMGSTEAINNFVYAGCIEPTNLQPFTEIPINVKDSPSKALALSPDGDKLATINGRSVDIYNLEQWKKSGQWSPWVSLPHPDGEYALSVAWSPDGNYLAAGFEYPGPDDPGLIVWNTGDNPSDYSMLYERMTSTAYESVNAVCWSPDSNYIMTGECLYNSIGARSRIWNLFGTNTWTSAQGPEDVNAVAWGNTGYRAIGFNEGSNGKVWIYSPTNSLFIIDTWDGEQVYSLEWNSDGSLLAVGTDNSGFHSPIYVYNTSGVLQSSFSEHTEKVTGLDWNPLTGKLVSCAMNQDIRIWEGYGGPSLVFGSGDFVDVSWTPEGQEILAATEYTDKIEIFAPYDGIGPTITIQYPSNNYTSTSSVIEISGSINDAHVVDNATITVNGGDATPITIGQNGSYSHQTDLTVGENILQIDAVDGCGNTSNKIISIIYSPPIPDFLLSAFPQTQSVDPGESATYTISVTPLEGFSSPVTLSANSDPIETDLNFSINPVNPSYSTDLTLAPSSNTATGLYEITINANGDGINHQVNVALVVRQPEINITQNGMFIPDDTGSYYFGETVIGDSKTVSFTIENIGNQILSLTGEPTVQVEGAGANTFVVIQQSLDSVNASSSQTFQIKFSPIVEGTTNATVSISNSDSDENPYNFVIIGTGIPDAERNALISLYNSTDGDNWSDNSGWKTPPLHTDGFAMPETKCDWFGVVCTGATVTTLYLYDNQLSGTIPAELGNLSNLQWLSLEGNQLTGSIPPELENLSNITDILLQSNYLTGSIPSSLGNLSTLERLWLSDNQLSGFIPPELGNLENLRDLYLENNQLNGSIPPELCNLSNMQRLELYGNQITGPIPSELGSLSNLGLLDINNNQISGSIPAEIGNLSELRFLFINDNQLSGEIPLSLMNINLVGLNICNNHLYTSDSELQNFLDNLQPGWEDCQLTSFRKAMPWIPLLLLNE